MCQLDRREECHLTPGSLIIPAKVEFTNTHTAGSCKSNFSACGADVIKISVEFYGCLSHRRTSQSRNVSRRDQERTRCQWRKITWNMYLLFLRFTLPHRVFESHRCQFNKENAYSLITARGFGLIHLPCMMACVRLDALILVRLCSFKKGSSMHHNTRSLRRD